MIKSILIVGCGSFLGGGVRFLLSRLVALVPGLMFPYATMAANLLGCLLIGLFTALYEGGSLSDGTKLFLTVGFCGGLTTFSTFMNENVQFFRSSDIMVLALYVVLSLVLGFIAVLLGYWVGKMM